MTADPRRWKALAVLGIAYLMVVLDVSIVNVALPSIQTDLGLRAREPPVGRQRLRAHLRRLPAARRPRRRPARAPQDLHGRPRSPSPPSRSCADSPPPTGMLIAARALQGAAGAILVALGLLDHHGHVRGGRRAQQGARHPRRHRRLRAPRSACCSAASSPSTPAGSGSSSSTPRSASRRSSSSRASCARAASRASHATSTRSARSP